MIMDVFRKFPDYNKALGTIKNQKDNRDERGMIIRDASDKPYKSSREIREKVELNRKKSGMPVKKDMGQKFGMSYMEAEPTVGDVGVNNPKDPMTKEKLKTLLSSGAMVFGDKEKQVLAKILNNK